MLLISISYLGNNFVSDGHFLDCFCLPEHTYGEKSMYTSFDIYLDYTVADKIFWSCQMDFELSSVSDGHSAFLETQRKIC